MGEKIKRISRMENFIIYIAPKTFEFHAGGVRVCVWGGERRDN